MHEEDIKKLSDSDKIFKELDNLPKETKANNFEEFWIGRVGKTLYERFNKFYNQKAWQLDDNKKMDAGFLGTVKKNHWKVVQDMNFIQVLLMLIH